MRLAIVALILCAGATAFCQPAPAGAASPDKQRQDPFLFSPWTDFCKQAPDAQRGAADAGKRFDQSHSRFSWQLDDGQGKLPIGSTTYLQLPGTGTLHANPLVAQNEDTFRPNVLRLWPNLKSEPIPTQWPHAKAKQIPTQWAKLKWLPIAGQPGTKASTPAAGR